MVNFTKAEIEIREFSAIFLNPDSFNSFRTITIVIETENCFPEANGNSSDKVRFEKTFRIK